MDVFPKLMLTSVVIYKQRLLHENEIVNYFIITNAMTLTKAGLENQSSTNNVKNNYPKKPVYFYRPFNL